MWYNRCFVECPSGFHSVLKAPTCWDLCVPNGHVYEYREMTHVPYSDKGVSEFSHQALGGGIWATAAG